MPIDFSKLRKKGEPLSKLPSKEMEKMQKMDEENIKLRNARLMILDTWNSLDNDLVELLRTVVGTPDPVIASALYFTPHTFRTRLDMIGKIVAHIVNSGDKASSLLNEWQKLSENLGKKRQVRNWASHGHIINYTEPNGKTHLLLAPVLMQVDNYLEAYRRNKKPGATLHEVEDAIDRVRRLSDDVKAFHAKMKERLGT